ncbi:MAG: hypothetical protein BZY75_01605 [SAR202 cluster bacterium Io17-Chloro-G7]|nr:MAG: hypothetical protein BZY75_01605 [SAR202 cluster bacterium Io17-Chloro-G7]
MPHTGQDTPIGGNLTAKIFVPLLTVVIVVISACGGASTAASSPASKPPASQLPVSDQAALDLLKRSTEVMDDIGSFRSHMDMEGRALGEKFSLSMDMEIDSNNGFHNVMEIDSPDGKITIEQILISPDVFTKVSGAAGGWSLWI